MNAFALMSLSVGMSMDAFTAALAKGATDKRPTLITAFKGGLLFGVVEAVAPILGYVLTKAASGYLVGDYIATFDHWIAFVLLMCLGLCFIHQALGNPNKEDEHDGDDSFFVMLLTAVATSIDSMVVGVSLAFLHVDIWIAALMIGITTTLMATLGLYLGNRLGRSFGKVAMAVGGMVLMMIGMSILYMHLTA